MLFRERRKINATHHWQVCSALGISGRRARALLLLLLVDISVVVCCRCCCRRRFTFSRSSPDRISRAFPHTDGVPEKKICHKYASERTKANVKKKITRQVEYSFQKFLALHKQTKRDPKIKVGIPRKLNVCAGLARHSCRREKEPCVFFRNSV